jgi:hypothetical protein
MHRADADIVFTVTPDFVRACQTPILILPDDILPHPDAVAMEAAVLAPNAQVSMYWSMDGPEKIPLAVRHQDLPEGQPAGRGGDGTAGGSRLNAAFPDSVGEPLSCRMKNLLEPPPLFIAIQLVLETRHGRSISRLLPGFTVRLAFLLAILAEPF